MSGISSCTTDGEPVAAAVAVPCPDVVCRREADFVGGEGDWANLGERDAVVTGGAVAAGGITAPGGTAAACCEVPEVLLVTDGAESVCPRKNRVPPHISTIPARTVAAIGTYDRSLACPGGGAN